MLSKKRKRLGYLMLFFAFCSTALQWSDIILRKNYRMTYRFPWAGSAALLMTFVFLTAGALIIFWRQEHPWRNTSILAIGAVVITLTAGLFLTSDLKIQESHELSSTEPAKVITWYNPETEKTTVWHTYKTIFLKEVPAPEVH